MSHFHSCLNTMPGRNSVLVSESSAKISTFLYKISKKRSGTIFTQCLKTNVISRCFLVSSASTDHQRLIRPAYSGNVVTISEIKSLIILLNSEGTSKSSNDLLCFSCFPCFSCFSCFFCFS